MSIPATMRALQQTSLNGPQYLRLITDAPVPAPGPSEILIRIAAAGVNFLDISQARGTFPGGPQPPYLAGFEAVGEIVAVGQAVTGLKLGAHVIGVNMKGGAFAEYMVLPAVAAVPVPAGWGDEQALGLVVNWPTALAALKPLGRIAAGQSPGATRLRRPQRTDRRRAGRERLCGNQAGVRARLRRIPRCVRWDTTLCQKRSRQSWAPAGIPSSTRSSTTRPWPDCTPESTQS